MNIFKEPEMPKHLIGELKALGYSFVESPPADIYYPTGKGVLHRLLAHLKDDDFSFYTHIPGTGYITAKDQLWVAVVLKHGWARAVQIFPETLLLRIARDRQRLLRLIELNNNIQLILKKNIQKRLGLKIISGYEWHDFKEKEDYVVAQSVLPTSRQFTTRPFHFRCYAVLTLNQLQLQFLISHKAPPVYHSHTII